MVQMFEKHVAHDFARENLELLCNIEVFLGLTCIIPMLECVQNLSKFVQTCDAFIYNFVVLRNCVGDLYCMYCNEQARYELKDVNQFINIMEHCNDVLHDGWVIISTYGIEYVVFSCFGRHIYMQYKHYTLIGALSWVSKVDWLVVVEEVKKQCNSIAQGLIKELDQRFPSQEIMNVTCIIYPQLWL